MKRKGFLKTLGIIGAFGFLTISLTSCQEILDFITNVIFPYSRFVTRAKFLFVDRLSMYDGYNSCLGRKTF